MIGRSGSGKTTCALMRLFSMEIVFRNTKLRHQHIASGLETPYICKPSLIDENFGLKNIFLTASPLLIV